MMSIEAVFVDNDTTIVVFVIILEVILFIFHNFSFISICTRVHIKR